MAEAKLDAILAAVEGLAGRMAALESRVDDLSIKMDVEVCHRLDTLTAKAAFTGAGVGTPPVSANAKPSKSKSKKHKHQQRSEAEASADAADEAQLSASAPMVAIAGGSGAAASGGRGSNDSGDEDVEREPVPTYSDWSKGIDDAMAVTMFRGDSVCVDVGPEDRVIIALTLTLDDDVADPTPTEVFVSDYFIYDSVLNTLPSELRMAPADGTLFGGDHDLVGVCRARHLRDHFMLQISASGDNGRLTSLLEFSGKVLIHRVRTDGPLEVVANFRGSASTSAHDIFPVLFTHRKDAGTLSVVQTDGRHPTEMLVKRNPVALTHGEAVTGVCSRLRLGLGWKGIRQRFRSIEVDLDLCLVYFDGDGVPLGFVDADTGARGVLHSGDDTSGRASGLNETITLHTTSLDPAIRRCVFVCVPGPGASLTHDVSKISAQCEALGYREGVISAWMVDSIEDDGIVAIAVLDVTPDFGFGSSPERWRLLRPDEGQGQILAQTAVEALRGRQKTLQASASSV